MVLRRKFKRIILLILFATMVIKIHKDYQELNSVNEKGLKSMRWNFNDSSHISIISLDNVKDIMLTENVINPNQRKETIKEQSTFNKVIQLPKINETKVEKKISQNLNDVNSESQADTYHLDTMIYNDTREYYYPSFKKKMEEASRQKLESMKTKKVDTILSSTLRQPEPPKPNLEPKSSNIDKNGKQEAKDGNNKTQPLIPSQQQHPNLKLNDSELRSKIQSIQNKLQQSSLHKLRPKPKKQVFKLSHVIDSKEISLNESELFKIKEKTKQVNKQQYIYNEEIYGPLQSNDTVIIIQVHNRLENLKHLVESLLKAQYINTSLVIFSHDFWDEGINAFVQGITSFKVLQIFFPYSIQLNPSSFPGRDPRDCLWDQKEAQASKTANCLNANWSDSYGHYREAAFTQIKHHWWWKLVHVFDHLHVIRNFTGQVMFLEEDHYVFPDVLHVLRLIVKERDKSYRDHFVFGLGNYQRYSANMANTVERGEWIVNKYNLGFVFSRPIFDIIKKCETSFCNYDDYNWDWTLTYLSKTCALNKFSILSMKVSRVLHIGSCGTHVKKDKCSLNKEVNIAKGRISSLESRLFPQSLIVQKTYRGTAKPKKSNGGWGDFRDKKLCVAIGNSTNSETALKELQFPKLKQGETAS